MSDVCRELRATLGAVALGNADAAETLALNAHLDGCAECRAELRELTSVADALRLADLAHLDDGPVQPPTALAAHVLDRVAAERTARRSRSRRRIAVAAATAAAIAAALVAFALVVPDNSPAGTKVVFSARPGVTASATLHSHAAGTEVAFHVAGLHDGSYYWLWLTGADDHRIAAGTFRGTTQRSDLVMTAAIPMNKARRIWVTDDRNRVVLDEQIPASA